MPVAKHRSPKSLFKIFLAEMRDRRLKWKARNNKQKETRWSRFTTALSMPHQWAGMFKNMQSVEGFGKLSQGHKDQVVNKKGETLSEYVERHTQITPEGKKQNRGIDDKGVGYRAAVKAFISSLSEEELKCITETGQRGGYNAYIKASEQERLELNNKQINRFPLKIVLKGFLRDQIKILEGKHRSRIKDLSSEEVLQVTQSRLSDPPYTKRIRRSKKRCPTLVMQILTVILSR